MATYTSYLNLEKPTTSETFNLLKMNQNWDKIDAGVSALNSNIKTIQNSQIKYMDITDTTPVNVNSKSGQVITINNFIGCAALTNGVLPMPYTNSGVQYIKLANYNDLSAFSGSATIRVWYR